jgi:hypothetical protein
MQKAGSTRRLGQLGRLSVNVACNVGVIATNLLLVEKAGVAPPKGLRKLKKYAKDYLPCYFEICTNPLAPGLLDAKLWGYGQRPRAPLAALSSFRLRIESERTSEPNFEGSNLSYGRLVDPKQIDLSIERT